MGNHCLILHTKAGLKNSLFYLTKIPQKPLTSSLHVSIMFCLFYIEHSFELKLFFLSPPPIIGREKNKNKKISGIGSSILNAFYQIFLNVKYNCVP